jgi:hypothetical protein
MGRLALAFGVAAFTFLVGFFFDISFILQFFLTLAAFFGTLLASSQTVQRMSEESDRRREERQMMRDQGYYFEHGRLQAQEMHKWENQPTNFGFGSSNKISFRKKKW